MNRKLRTCPLLSKLNRDFSFVWETLVSHYVIIFVSMILARVTWYCCARIPKFVLHLEAVSNSSNLLSKRFWRLRCILDFFINSLNPWKPTLVFEKDFLFGNFSYIYYIVNYFIQFKWNLIIIKTNCFIYLFIYNLYIFLLKRLLMDKYYLNYHRDPRADLVNKIGFTWTHGLPNNSNIPCT